MLIDDGGVGRPLDVGLVAGDGGAAGGPGVGGLEHGVGAPVAPSLPTAPGQQEDQRQQAADDDPSGQADAPEELADRAHSTISKCGPSMKSGPGCRSQ